MGRLVRFVCILISLSLAGCAQLGGQRSSAPPFNFNCAGTSICPIIIYEKFPGVFATFPDWIHFDKDAPGKALLWTFADQVRYRFDPSTNDGFEPIGTTSAALGIGPCAITDESLVPLGDSQFGVYLRCENHIRRPFGPTHYRMRFHDNEGNLKVVDPTVDSSGGLNLGAVAPGPGKAGSARGSERPKATKPDNIVQKTAGEDVDLPKLDPTYAYFRVVLDATAGYKFTDLGDVVISDGANAASVGPVYISTKADGSDIADEGQYYVIKTALSTGFTYTYTAARKNSQGGSVPATPPKNFTKMAN